MKMFGDDRDHRYIRILFTIEAIFGSAWLIFSMQKLSLLLISSIAIVIAAAYAMVRFAILAVDSSARQQGRYLYVWRGVIILLGLLFVLLARIFNPAEISWLIWLFSLEKAVRIALVMAVSGLLFEQNDPKRPPSQEWLVKLGLFAFALLLLLLPQIQNVVLVNLYFVTEFILLWQLCAVIGAAVLFHLVTRLFGAWKYYDLLIFLGIWICAAICWSLTPIGSMIAANINSDPNFQFIPTLDQYKYDMIANKLALGSKSIADLGSWATLSYTMMFGKMLIGYDTLDLMRAQAIFLGINPALLYLLGREGRSRMAGFLSAGLYVFLMINIMASEKTTVAITTLLTEPLMSLGMILITFLLMKLWRKPTDPILLLLYGATVGFFGLVRVNGLVFLILPMFFLIRKLPNWPLTALKGSMLVAFGWLLIVTPFMIRNIQVGKEPIYFAGKVNDLVRRVTGDSEKRLIGNKENDWQKNYEPNNKDNSVEYAFDPNLVLERLIPVGTYDFNLLPRSTNDPSLRETSNFQDRPLLKTFGFIPSSFQASSFLINAILCVFGLGWFSYKRKFEALVPLGIYGIYFTTTIFSSTLIPRHQFPINWIPIYCYSIGMVAFINFLFPKFALVDQPDQPVVSQKSGKLFILVSILLALLGMLSPMVEAMIPKPTFTLINAETLSEGGPELPSEFADALQGAGYDPDLVAAFLANDPEAILMDGFVLYPIDGFDVENTGLEPNGLFTMTILNDHVQKNIRLLPGPAERPSKPGDRVLVLTCPDPLREKREVGLISILIDKVSTSRISNGIKRTLPAACNFD